MTSGNVIRLGSALAIVVGAALLFAVGQQMAIWNSNAGWVLAGSLLIAAVSLGMAVMRRAVVSRMSATDRR